MNSKVPNCIPGLFGRELEYVTDAVRNVDLAVGPHIGRLESCIAEFTGAAHAVALSSGTAALHLALIAAGVKANDEVVLPTLTFAATANAVFHAGARPVFLDVESEGWGLSPDALSSFLEHCLVDAGRLRNPATGRCIGAIMPVHLYGHPCDFDAVLAVAKRFDIPVVEDGTEALGALYKGRTVGSLHRLCGLSFNGNKIITGGQGGMVLAAEVEQARRIRYLAAQARDRSDEFEHGDVGYNYRMANINAALALAQAEQLAKLLKRKREIFAIYDEAFRKCVHLHMWSEAEWAASSYWMPIIVASGVRAKNMTRRLKDSLPAMGIEARATWMPLHKQSPYRNCHSVPITTADDLYERSLCLPCSTGMSDSDIARVIDAIRAMDQS